MLVSIEEIRQLRETLKVNRMEHENLVTKAKILREHCQEIKEMCDQTSKEMQAIISCSRQSRQDAQKDSHA